MLSALFVNACIMMTLITIGYHFSKDMNHLPMTVKVAAGLYGGISGILLMTYSVYIGPSIIVDFRNFAIAVTALFGGFIPALTASLIIAAYRILFIGMSAAAIKAGIAISVIGLGSGLISKTTLSFGRKWAACLALNLATGVTVLYSVLSGHHDFLSIIGHFSAGTLVISFFLYYLLTYYITTYEVHNRLKNESAKDYLTGLINVREFDLVFNRIVNRISRKEEKLSLLMLDIDHFKKVNDTYGHASGDLVLKGFAKLLVDTCRDFDIISRNGGEEFSVILLDCPMNHAIEVSERIRRAVESAVFTSDGGKEIRITVSIGIAAYPDTTSDLDEIISQADRALYQAKQGGRNRSVLFEAQRIG